MFRRLLAPALPGSGAGHGRYPRRYLGHGPASLAPLQAMRNYCVLLMHPVPIARLALPNSGLSLTVAGEGGLECFVGCSRRRSLGRELDMGGTLAGTSGTGPPR